MYSLTSFGGNLAAGGGVGEEWKQIKYFAGEMDDVVSNSL